MSVTVYGRLRLSIPNVNDYSKHSYRVRFFDKRGGNLIADEKGIFLKDGVTKEHQVSVATEVASKNVFIAFDVYDPIGKKINTSVVRGRRLTQKGSTNHKSAQGETSAWPVYTPEVTLGVSQPPKETTVNQAISGKVRLLFHGGARMARDNSAFYFASLNVKKDYEKLFPHDTIIHKRPSTDSAKDIVDAVNAQKKGAIASLDLFSHGGEAGLFFIKGASLTTTIDEKTVENGKLKAYLYASRTIKTFDITAWGERHDDDRIIYDFEFDRFAEGVVVEIHGCNTGNPHFLLETDSIVKNLSEAMPSAYVIGHTTQANPSINGPQTTNEQQDYRHGSRVIWQGGEVIKEVTIKGHIDTSRL